MSEDTEMWAPGESVVNRVSMLLVPKAPWHRWAASMDAQDAPPPIGTPGNTYLLPPYEHEEEVSTFIRENFELFFEEELVAWTEDETRWPASRTWEDFEAWFEVFISPLVYDLGDEPLGTYTIEEDD